MPKTTNLKTTDLVVYRSYTYNRINIIIKLDFIEKTISIVERDKSYGKDGFRPKKFTFSDRTEEYLNGWRLILKAMDLAVEQAKKELEEANKKDLDKLVNTLVELDKLKDKKL